MVDKPNRIFTLDDNTYASNPGGLDVNYWCWIRSFPKEPLRISFELTVAIAFALLVNWAFWKNLLAFPQAGMLTDWTMWHIDSLSSEQRTLITILVLIGLINWAFWIVISSLLQRARFLAIHIRERFLYGCVNPGIVVALKPPLVAVFTDLTTTDIPCHVIKILPQPLRWTNLENLSIGTRLATIAGYQGDAQQGHWDNFHPVVVNCVTNNQTDIDRVFQNIPDWEWLELKLGLAQVPKQPGLYKIS
ncbi:MAG: DUF3239 domain-containing protein [Oculatellaceae cyanobacterium bins.114]|nr:DUF3239 domain-containing protein [Oculatellaceae cyanobacterium bins.114]